MTIFPVSSENSALLSEFHHGLYTREFPDPDERESLANMENYLRLKEQGWYGRNNYHILLAEDESGSIVAGIIADFLAKPNCGIIEFIVIDPVLRGQGLGRQLLTEITACFQADAIRAGNSALDGICGEVNDPYRRCDVNDHLDGFARLATWNRYGFSLLDFPYVQPSLGEGQDAVNGLGLMFKPCCEDYQKAVPAPLVESIIREFQIWAMRIEKPDEEPEFSAMRDHLRGQDRIELLDMLEYIGEEIVRPFLTVELGPDDPRFPDFAELYLGEFDDEETAVEISAFRSGSQAGTEPFPFHYWLWGLEAPAVRGFSGFASFFSFPHCGFGGYLALCGTLRGRGLFRRFLRLMERKIVEKNDKASGWYVECEPESSEATAFQRCGFTRVPMNYLQPRLHTDRTGESQDKVLEILYKPFGRRYAPPVLSSEDLIRDLRDVIMVVYRMDFSSAEDALDRMIIPAGEDNVFRL